MPDFRWTECPVLIPYMGGKFELSRTLVPMIPSHNRYVEVFAGGASMFFRKKKVQHNILNDKHNDLVNLYICVKEHFDEFKEQTKCYLKSRYLFDDFRRQIKEVKDISIPDIKRASRYYYVIKNAFNNSVHNPISKEAEWHTHMVEFLELSRKKLDNVMIENLDFREMITRYPPRSGDFWYLDPPYVIAGERGDYYFHNFNSDDHDDFVEMIDELDRKGAYFMVSYDNRQRIKTSFSKYNIKEIPIRYSGQLVGSDVKIELVITNYENRGQASLF